MYSINNNSLASPSIENMKRINNIKNSDSIKIDEIDNRDKTSKIQKRSGAIEWDEYFMSVAYLSAMRSKDPSTQVGACIVNEDNRIVGIGYNGFPRGCRHRFDSINYH